ncbi:MAG: EF-hand domain-containing protein [Opitutales bacterium]|nr:EF-hand domain-containing protein [Opitutales bacterium]
MKKITVLLSIALAFSAYAQNTSKPEVPKPQIDIQSKIQLMKQFDKDGDGRLNAEERKLAMEAIKNKSVNLNELRQKHVDDIMQKFDKDGDSKLDKTELATFLEEQRKILEKRRMGPRRNFRVPKEVLAEFDKDGDGKLNTEERKAMFKQAREKRDALLKKYDADGDGVLNESERDKLIEDPEVKKQMRRMFSRPIERR